MSWRHREDLGTQVVAHVHEAMRVNDHWCLDTGRGFMWWAEDFVQRIWSDIGLFHNSQSVYRVHAETDLLKGRGHAKDFELALTTAMRDATLSAVVYDSESDTYKLHCSVYAHNENSDFMDRLFMAASALQVAEAHEIGHHLAQKLQATPASSAHPSHGIRNSPDPMIRAIETFFKPNGGQPSRWIGRPEWREMERAMERQALHFTTDHDSYLQAEFFWPIPAADGSRQVSVLNVSTAEANPILGNGLIFRLRLPVRLSPGACAHTAMELNNIERKEWLRCQFLGSWCYDDGALEFECFVPNTCFNASILENLSLSMAIRAQWAAEQFEKWFASRAPSPAGEKVQT